MTNTQIYQKKKKKKKKNRASKNQHWILFGEDKQKEMEYGQEYRKSISEEDK